MGHRSKQRPPVLPASTNTPITPTNTPSVNLAVSGVDSHTLAANVRLSAIPGNRLVVVAGNGLGVLQATHSMSVAAGVLTSTVDGVAATVTLPAETPNAKVDTATVAIALSGPASRTIAANVKLDAAAGLQNKLTATANGLRVAPTRKTRIVTATGTITAADSVVIVNNGAANVTLSFVGAFDPDHSMAFTRAPGSTGAVTLQGVGRTFQSLAGAVGATTTLPIHSAAGGGVRNGFVLNGTTWYRVS